MPNPRGVNQYSKGRGSKGKAAAWPAPKASSIMHPPKSVVGSSRFAASASAKTRKITKGPGTIAQKASRIAAVQRASGISVGNANSHKAFIAQQLKAKAARAKGRGKRK